MILFIISFENGDTLQEYGNDVADIRQFCARTYADKGAPVTITEQV
ncbi:hypothetical protein RYA05_01990 [Pseudomonas syringae pv. actinidiae]|nr:hypothetical protein [Pseudomonas syringae pv. actinidiae]